MIVINNRERRENSFSDKITNGHHLLIALIDDLEGASIMVGLIIFFIKLTDSIGRRIGKSMN
jgi:hypothetical protein